jgi:hypothetical protein
MGDIKRDIEDVRLNAQIGTGGVYIHSKHLHTGVHSEGVIEPKGKEKIILKNVRVFLSLD